MYSPKIREDLVERLYRIAKEKRIPMTALVNGYVEKALSNERYESNTESHFVREQQSSLHNRPK